jgi:NADH-quinone oxidoreductase subunit K
MLSLQYTTNIILFLIGVSGILINRKNVLIVLMCIEIMLLSVNLNFLVSSVYMDDFIGHIFSLFILTVAAGESAIGLAILILYNRIRNRILISEITTLKN